MKAVTYDWWGVNKVEDFQEGNEIFFPFCDGGYIDSVKPSQKEGKLIMTLLSEQKPHLLRRIKHEVIEAKYFLKLDKKKQEVLRKTHLSTEYSTKGISTDYQEKLERLRELQGGLE